MKDKKRHSLIEILFGETIIPRYIPFYHRLFLLWLKLSRSVKKRLSPLSWGRSVIPDEVIRETDKAYTFGPGDLSAGAILNKTFSEIDTDLEREDIHRIAKRIETLKEDLERRELKFTSAAGSFKAKDFIALKERYKLWENAWVLTHAGVNTGDTVLDIGGASSIFSYLLADMGAGVHVIDNDWGSHGIIYNGRFVAKRMGWDMKHVRRDISKRLPFKKNFFDKVFCVCVLEHLSSSTRRHVMREIKRVLKPGGMAALTLDYDAGRNTPGLDRGIRYSFRRRLMKDIITPSGLKIYGNTRLVDDCASDFFLGTLFLVK